MSVAEFLSYLLDRDTSRELAVQLVDVCEDRMRNQKVAMSFDQVRR